MKDKNISGYSIDLFSFYDKGKRILDRWRHLLDENIYIWTYDFLLQTELVKHQKNEHFIFFKEKKIRADVSFFLQR